MADEEFPKNSADKDYVDIEKETSQYLLTCSAEEYFGTERGKIEIKKNGKIVQNGLKLNCKTIDIINIGTIQGDGNSLENILLKTKEDLMRKGRTMKAYVITDLKPSISISKENEKTHYSIYFIGNAIIDCTNNNNSYFKELI